MHNVERAFHNDPAWFELVRARLKTSDAVDYRLAEPDKSSPGLSSDIADPRSYLSDDAAFRGYSFKNYASQIDAFPDDYFDVVLIDGRARPACIMHSVPKIKTGGLLIVDNSDRKYYFEHTKTILEKFRVIVFRGVTPTVAFMSSTTVFIKVD